MENNLSTQWDPALSGVRSQQKERTYSPAGKAEAETGFRETFQSALKTTESMESIFREASQLYGVELNLLKAIGKAESNFNPSAVSSAGAQGVMQLMPATARSLGVADSLDARSNIMGGAKYFAGLMERYNGDAVLALSAYNAGSGNVEKYGGVPPFQETQNYIKKVLAYAGEDIDLSGVFGGAVTGGGVFGIQSWIAELEELAAGGSAFDSAGTLFSQEDAQYMVEMMRLQMQNIFQKEVFSDEEEEGTSAVGSLL